MKPVNQHIVVYGFITLDDDPNTTEQWQDEIDKEFAVRYAMTVRGKDSDQFEWTYLEPATNVVKTSCKANHDICTYFPVGFIPFIEYDMYDVAIEILPSDSLSELH